MTKFNVIACYWEARNGVLDKKNLRKEYKEQIRENDYSRQNAAILRLKMDIRTTKKENGNYKI
jgi:hypothetical protein